MLQSLACDVPILGYQTKNTINLCLWEEKATVEDFNLFLFNDGQHDAASMPIVCDCSIYNRLIVFFSTCKDHVTVIRMNYLH